MGAIALILPLYTISLGPSITISSVRLKFNTNGPVNVFEICPKSVIFTNIKNQRVATVLIASSLFLIQYPSKRELPPLLRTFLLSSSFYITHKSESKIIAGCAGFILKCKVTEMIEIPICTRKRQGFKVISKPLYKEKNT